jgi:catechol 2,3-dioxygenase-like lactoylglutathione lyase family enzyme
MLMRRYRGRLNGRLLLEVTMLRSLHFLGVRTAAFAETVALYRDVFGLVAVLERPGATWFQADDGSSIHVYSTDDADHEFFGSAPVVGLEVADFDATRAALVDAGVELIGDPQRDGGVAWNHYRGPDGNVYEIIGPDRSPA